MLLVCTHLVILAYILLMSFSSMVFMRFGASCASLKIHFRVLIGFSCSQHGAYSRETTFFSRVISRTRQPNLCKTPVSLIIGTLVAVTKNLLHKLPSLSKRIQQYNPQMILKKTQQRNDVLMLPTPVEMERSILMLASYNHTSTIVAIAICRTTKSRHRLLHHLASSFLSSTVLKTASRTSLRSGWHTLLSETSMTSLGPYLLWSCRIFRCLVISLANKPGEAEGNSPLLYLQIVSVTAQKALCITYQALCRRINRT